MYPDVMIDLETTGTDPGHAAIIQIAAVRFDYVTAEIGPSYVASLEMAPFRYWDESTREWWMKKSDLYQQITSTARDAREVFTEFQRWCCDTSPGLQDSRMWAKPIHFEWAFLASYAKQFDLELPFHYRNAIDLNSFTRGMQDNPGAQPIDKQFDIPFVGTEHDALDDCLHQIRQALMAGHLIHA